MACSRFVVGTSQLLLLLSLAASAGGTPTSADLAALEVRATNTLNAGQYAQALPMLEKLEAAYSPNGQQPDKLKLAAVQEQIRFAQRNLTNPAASLQPKPAIAQPIPYDPKGNAPNLPPGVTLPAGYDPANDPDLIQVETSAELRAKHAAPDNSPREFSNIRLLGNFDYDADKGGNIPADVLALSGSTIRVRGYMIPLDQAAEITNFALVPSLFACCFGQPPSIQHTVIVKTPPNKAVAYYPDEIVVEGTLTVEEKKDEGFIISVFDVTASSVRPAAK
jgi:hypothetical protein